MKYCSNCKQKKDILEFGKNKSQKDGSQRWCKQCDREWKANWFANNRKKQLERIQKNNQKANLRNQEKVWEYFSTHPCVDCGNTNILCLQFDHINKDKMANISEMLTQGLSWEKIANEIAKCDVRCANCHMIVTLQRGNFARYRWFVQWQDTSLIQK